VETAECWELALQNTKGPSLMALSRQNLPTVRVDATENKSAKGAYILSPANSSVKAVIFSSGSEIEIALAAQKMLEEKGIGDAGRFRPVHGRICRAG
jgi:transketolase